MDQTGMLWNWDTIVDPKNGKLLELADAVKDNLERQHQEFINVNNHYEGCAPRTIEKVKALLKMV